MGSFQVPFCVCNFVLFFLEDGPQIPDLLLNEIKILKVYVPENKNVD